MASSRRLLAVLAHPNPRSFCRALLDAVVEAARAKGAAVEVRDLYAERFDPVLKGEELAALERGEIPAEIRAEQERVRHADLIAFVYPMWWQGAPAMLRGWFDRVLSQGFAYDFGPGGVVPRLAGKRALILTTMGAPVEEYEKNGMLEAVRRTSDEGVFGFCGIEVVGHIFFGAVPRVDDAARRAMLEEARRAAAEAVGR